MPRRRGSKKRKRKDDKNTRPPKKPRGEHWTPWCTENELFSTYYSEQPFIPPSEFQSFTTALRTELPTTIRINETGQFKDIVKNKLFQFHESMKEVKYLPSPESTEEVAVDPPSPIPWYPLNGRLSSGDSPGSPSAWQFSMARRFLKKSKCASDLKNFIVMHNSLGTLSRQEAVSMIPTLFMDVMPHHYVLDMCAAPGSKTMQLIEDLHHSTGTRTFNGVPEGLIIANDSNPQRCHTLSTQIKRIGTPCIVITNHRAQFFPALTVGTTPRKTPDNVPPVAPESQLFFDRILCDVPCSGDGTLRKNPDIWQKWNPLQGVGLHRTQVEIAWRAFSMLAVGGRMVYSTCSLNPCEDEAVVAHLLLLAKGACTLVDVSHHLPNLRRTPGIHQWKIMDKNGNCFRILPHYQDTGGFFVAVLEKTAALPHYRVRFHKKPENQSEAVPVIGQKKEHVTEVGGGPTETNLGEKETTTVTVPIGVDQEGGDQEGDQEDLNEGDDDEEEEEMKVKNPKIKVQKNVEKENKPQAVNPNVEQFLPLPGEILPRWLFLKEYYGISDSFPFENLHARASTSKDGLPQKLYFLTSNVINLINNPDNKKLKVLNSGVKVFQKMTHDYRPCQEGLAIIFPYVTKRVVPISRSDLVFLLTQKDPSEILFCEDTQLVLKSLEPGPCLFSLKDDQCSICCVGFRGKTYCSLYMRNNEKKLLVQVLCPEGDEIRLALNKEIQTKNEGDTLEEHGKKENINQPGDTFGVEQEKIQTRGGDLEEMEILSNDGKSQKEK